MAGLAFIIAACLVFTVQGFEMDGDKHPLADEEKYLEPYLGELIDYREHPIGERFIRLADLVDAPPTWIEDLFVPLLIPGSSLTIPLNMTIPFKIPGSKIPLPGSFTLTNITVNDLNKFKTLRPLKLRKDARFSWTSEIDIKELEIVANVYLKVLGKRVDVKVTLPLVKPSVKLSMVIAFNRTRLCDVWGSTMRGSLNCAAWPLAIHEEYNVSGVNLTTLEIGLDDFNFSLNVTGLGDKLDRTLQDEIGGAIAAAKPLILNLMPNISSAVQETLNIELLNGIQNLQRKSPCQEVSSATTYNVSRICVSNNGLDVLRLNLHDCPAHFVSRKTWPSVMDGRKCTDVAAMVHDVAHGDSLRVAMQAVVGIHEIIDPDLRYVPDSNVAGFECSGTGLYYNCNFVSLAPVDPAVLPRVSEVCVINHMVGIEINFKEQNQRTGNWTERTKDFPLQTRKCVDLGSIGGAAEGDVFKTKVNAVLGFDKFTDRDVQYVNNGLAVTYECRGTTVLYSCSVLGAASPLASLLV